MIKSLVHPTGLTPVKRQREPRGVQFVRSMEDSQRRAELPRRIIKAVALGGIAAATARYAAPAFLHTAASMARNAKFAATSHARELGTLEVKRIGVSKVRKVGQFFKRLLPKSLRPAEKPMFSGNPQGFRKLRVVAAKRAEHINDLAHGAISYAAARGAMRGMLIGRKYWKQIGSGVTGGSFAFGQYRALRRRHQALERAWQESSRKK